MGATVDFERFRPHLVEGLGCSDGAKGGRPRFDPVAMFKVLVVRAQHNFDPVPKNASSENERNLAKSKLMEAGGFA